jgi:two-component system sensor histidine kinase KdpD
MPGKISEMMASQYFKLLVIIITTLGAIIFDLFGQMHGVSIFAPLLFFLPIIIAAYWYPQKGVLYAVGMGILQLLLVTQYGVSDDLAPLTYATATASFYVLVAVGVVVSALSANLKEQEARYYAVFDHSQAGIILIREAEQKILIEEVNRRGGEILGYLPADLAGSKLERIWNDPDNLRILIKQVEKSVNATDIESQFLTREGSLLPVLMSAARLPVNRLVITFMDITQRKKAEEDIKRRNKQLTTVNQVITITSTACSVQDLMKRSFEKIQDLFLIDSGAIYLLDAERQHLVSTYTASPQPDQTPLPGKIEVKENPFHDVITNGRAVYGMYPGNTGVDPGIAHMSAAIPVTCEAQVIGVLYLVSQNNQAFGDNDRSVLESIGREIGCTLKKLRLSEELIDANRKANLYLDILVHDINNANLASLGYGDLLAEMVIGRAKEMAMKMIEGVQKSREIIRNLETIRHIQEKKTDIKPINLNTVINQEIRHFPTAHIDYQGIDTMVLADDLIGETLTNLIGNSVKFGGPGVHITVIVRDLPDGNVEVTIQDNGPGVPDELKPVIFNRFQKGYTKGSGKGLGLYIAKTLLERYGGHIWIEDRFPGDYTRGAAIKFTLRKYHG